MSGMCWTSQDIVRALGVSLRTVQTWAKHNFIPSARVGPRGRLRFDEKAVAEAVRAKASAPQPASK